MYREGDQSLTVNERMMIMVTASNIERNKVSIRNLIEEVINVGRLDLCDRFLAADRVDHQDYGFPPGAADGHEGFRRVLGVFCGAFPDLHLEIEFMIAEGDRLMCHVSTTGTHTGPFMGMPPTGRKFKVNGTDIFRFNDEGKVSAHWGVFDTLGMMVQLGLLPTPEQAQAA
jgi:predicted ester cyclase